MKTTPMKHWPVWFSGFAIGCTGLLAIYMAALGTASWLDGRTQLGAAYAMATMVLIAGTGWMYAEFARDADRRDADHFAKLPRRVRRLLRTLLGRDKSKKKRKD